MNVVKLAVTCLAQFLAISLSSPAVSESFNVTGIQVVTHSGSNLAFKPGDNKLDRNNNLICTSDKGCSVVAQAQVTYDNNLSPLMKVCTEIDDVALAPPCQQVQSGDWQPSITTFQGASALSKGTHKIRTTVNIYGGGSSIAVLGYKVVYTLYQH